MTMAANREGQSILEFLILMPLMVAFVTILVKSNTAIQSGIVNQQYARLQTHFMTFNNAWYPDISFQVGNLAQRKAGLFPLAISEDSVDPNDETFETYPKAPLFSVARSPASEGLANASDDAGTEDVDRRVRVRVRQSAAICVPNMLAGDGSPYLAIDLKGGSGTDKYGVPSANALWRMNEQTVPQFCAPDSTRVDP